MALARFQRTLVDAAGNVLSNATVTVRRRVSGSPLGVIFSDRAGAVAIANPIVIGPSDNGLVAFHAAGGAYQIVAVAPGGYTVTWDYVGIGTAQEQDAPEFNASGWQFQYETNTAAPPTIGCVRFNTATVGAATTAYLSYTTAFGSDATNIIQALAPGLRTYKNTIIFVTQVDGLTFSYSVDSLIDHTTYAEIGLSAHTGESTIASGAFLFMQRELSGADGNTGIAAQNQAYLLNRMLGGL